MSYSNDYSYTYSSGDDSLSYVSDLSTSSPSFYCPLHYPPPPSTLCPIHQPYPFYFQIAPLPPIRQEEIPIEVRQGKKVNRRFTEEQIRILEEHFYKVDKYLSKVTIDELSTRTQLKPSQIRVWFNNKRTRQHH